MNLNTTYLGMTLRTPLVAGASPLSQDVDAIKRLEDAGAAALVLHSLFEEQFRLEQYELSHHLNAGTESYAEALSYFPEPDEFVFSPDQYLEHIRRVKDAVSMPIIGSLNGRTLGGWTEFAKDMAQAGVDALELNIYNIPTDTSMTALDIENQYLSILKAVKEAVSIPVAVKLSPFFTNVANLAKRLDEAGANGLVLFNRFYQPDVNLESLEVEPNLNLSTRQAMRLPMRWIAILFGRIKCNLAASSGIHSHEDVIKMLMVGANVTMLCSALLKNGPGHIKTLEHGLESWLETHEYKSVWQLQGSMSQENCEDPSAYERAQYMKVLKSYAPA